VRFEKTLLSSAMMRISCGGVLFDMDGVLVDSTPAVARVWSMWARKHGFDAEAIVKMAHGRPSLATIEELLPRATREVHLAEDREVERAEIEDVADVVALPGAKHLITALPANRIAMVTSATRALAEVRVAAAGLPALRHMVTASEITRGKPDPEPYLQAARTLGIPTAKCIVVEDAPAGVRSGKAAGARVIALRTTTGEEELRAAGADWIVDDCSSLCFNANSNEREIIFTFSE
jgi:mannitol-1-/sugar-/sorbitol-6-phosphatase